MNSLLELLVLEPNIESWVETLFWTSFNPGYFERTLGSIMGSYPWDPLS